MGNGASIIDYVEAGLRVSRLRQSVIANNVANLDTPGFRRKEVAFEEIMEKALRGGRRVDLAGIVPRLIEPGDTPLNESGSDVSLEMEVGELIRNSGAYRTYLRMLGKIYRQMEMATQTP